MQEARAAEGKPEPVKPKAAKESDQWLLAVRWVWVTMPCGNRARVLWGTGHADIFIEKDKVRVNEMLASAWQ